MTLLRGFYDGIKPTPVTLISDWADKNRRLSTDSAAEPGRYRVARTEYVREILDCLSPNSPVQEVYAIKGRQLGFTEAALNVLGCFADVAPCPMMYVMPTIDMAKEVSENRVDPMIEFCEVLQKKIKPNRERDSGNTKFTKRFPGGSWKLSGANSASSLRSKAVRVLVLDEPDGYPLNVDGEGSPISLAKARQDTFGSKKKLYMLSTPTMEHTSVIEPAFLKTDQRKYHVPCPACEHKQVLQFKQMRWKEGMGDHLEEVLYECEHCGHMIEERFKTKMFERGEWIPTKPENVTPTKRGYWISSLYSPIGWLSWVQIIKQFEASENDVNDRIVFTNTILAETWKETGEVPAWEELFQRREQYEYNKPSDEVCFITSGVDVQKDRLEVHIVGWCKRKVMMSIDYRIIHGDTTKPEVWDELAEIVNETWARPDGIELPMYRMAVDTGYNTSHVHTFCRRFDVTRVVPVKGDDKLGVSHTSPRAVDTARSGKKIGRVKVWMVGVSFLKTEIYGCLKQRRREDGTVPPGYMHFPQYDEKFFRGLTAEQLLSVTDKKGQTKYEWHRKYLQNEPLDTTVYARAAASMVGIDRMKDYHYDATLNKFGGKRKIILHKPKDGENKAVEQPKQVSEKRKKRGPSSIW
jgi:phage terminase large subunit GpA-like protein